MTIPEMLEASFAGFSAVDLAGLNAAAALTQRVDTKYLLPVSVLEEVLHQLRSSHRCLEIESRRSFRYSSSYVDSPELTCFHDHRREVRKRWKARTRVYEDSGQARWEVKLKDGRGLTVKRALQLPDGPPTRVTHDMLTFLDEVLRNAYEFLAPAGLSPSLTVNYRRSTLTDLSQGTRMTIDYDLSMVSPAGAAMLRPDLVLVETKSLTGRSRADAILRAAGARSCSISKYCAGMALLNPALPQHSWRQQLRRSFVSTAAVPSSQRHPELAA